VERSASKVIHFCASSGANAESFRIAIRYSTHGDEPVSDFGVAAQFNFGDIKEIMNVTGLAKGHRDQ
jgi:hypothetical protein